MSSLPLKVKMLKHSKSQYVNVKWGYVENIPICESSMCDSRHRFLIKAFSFRASKAIKIQIKIREPNTQNHPHILIKRSHYCNIFFKIKIDNLCHKKIIII